MTKEVAPLDVFSDGVPCPECGSPAWVVDGDGAGRFWLLCLDTTHSGCVATRPLPEGVAVAEPPATGD